MGTTFHGAQVSRKARSRGPPTQAELTPDSAIDILPSAAGTIKFRHMEPTEFLKPVNRLCHFKFFQLPEKPLRPDPICRGSLWQWHEMALVNGTRSLRARDQAVHQQTELGVFQRRATEERGEVEVGRKTPSIETCSVCDNEPQLIYLSDL